jgi:signal transduction histidine kinase
MSAGDSERPRDAFLEMLGHELRQPLAPIQTALAIMRQRRSREVGERARHTVERQVSQLIRLVEDLLDYSEAQRGLLRLRTERVDLRQVLEAAIETAQPTLRHREQRLELSSLNSVQVIGDGARLTQVFANLLNNAARFSEPGSEIAVIVEARETDVAIRIRDLNHTIPAEMVRDIARLFVNVDDEARWPTSGIGLAVVRTLVELHGGSVQAIGPSDGRGAEFLVILPLRVAEHAINQSSAPRAHSERDPLLS